MDPRARSGRSLVKIDPKLEPRVGDVLSSDISWYALTCQSIPARCLSCGHHALDRGIESIISRPTDFVHQLPILGAFDTQKIRVEFSRVGLMKIGEDR